MDKTVKKIFEFVVLELRDWRACRYMLDGFDSEDEAEFEQCITTAIVRGITEGECLLVEARG